MRRHETFFEQETCVFERGLGVKVGRGRDGETLQATSLR